jgi:hypothetical protein
MARKADDEAPTTRRTPTPGGRAPRAWCVVRIAYREPTYAQRSGTDKTYSCCFVVEARDERDAIAQAKAQFEAMAAKSGVGWIREIEHVECEWQKGPAS